MERGKSNLARDKSQPKNEAQWHPGLGFPEMETLVNGNNILEAVRGAGGRLCRLMCGK
jgi:hypothetical protein